MGLYCIIAGVNYNSTKNEIYLSLNCITFNIDLN